MNRNAIRSEDLNTVRIVIRTGEKVTTCASVARNLIAATACTSAAHNVMTRGTDVIVTPIAAMISKAIETTTVAAIPKATVTTAVTVAMSKREIVTMTVATKRKAIATTTDAVPAPRPSLNAMMIVVAPADPTPNPIAARPVGLISSEAVPVAPTSTVADQAVLIFNVVARLVPSLTLALQAGPADLISIGEAPIDPTELNVRTTIAEMTDADVTEMMIMMMMTVTGIETEMTATVTNGVTTSIEETTMPETDHRTSGNRRGVRSLHRM